MYYFLFLFIYITLGKIRIEDAVGCGQMKGQMYYSVRFRNHDDWLSLES